MVRDISEDTNRTVRDIKTATQRYEDNISKKMADLRMSPWRGAELEDAHQSEAESRARISGLERELHEVTRTGMAYRYHQLPALATYLPVYLMPFSDIIIDTNWGM